MSSPLRFAAIVCGVMVTSLSPAAGTNVVVPPADNPYAPAYAALARLSPADLEALKAGKPASAAAAPLMAEIARGLAAGRTASSVSWGVDYEHFSISTNIPLTSESLLLTKIALADTEGAPPSVLVDRALDDLALAHHFGQNNLLISFMVERAIETRTDDWLQKHLAQFSPKDAARFLAGLNTLPPGGDLTSALTVDKMVFIDPLAVEIRRLMEKLGDTAPTANSFASHLRLAGILTDGPVTAVGLEQNDQSFWLKPGENKHGITLLSVDRTRDEALLACNGQVARVRLSSRAITTIDLSRFEELVKALPPDNVLRLVVDYEKGTNSVTFIQNLELATHQMDDLCTEAILHPEHLNDIAAYKARMQQLTPWAKSMAETLLSISTREKAFAERRAKLVSTLSAVATPPAR
ncbi:MAG: hypothetical protein JF599_03810 [Verrucomicrobia bacterium]|nr:hypothetical protein [Verrucomicrobiota bacterium]